MNEPNETGMPGTENERILVVEDDNELLDFIASGLEEEGFEVLRASNGRQGLDSALDHLPDLVLTDIMMPVMDGVALCNELKTNSMTAHIPVIMLTAKNTVESQIEGLETGADDYVTKPFHMALVELRIRNLLLSRKTLSKKVLDEFLQLNRTGAVRNEDRAFIENAYAVVERHCADPAFRPEDFAEALKLGMRSLQRKLKAALDSTPMKFITEVRMGRAAKLLAGTEKSITEITFEVGFDDSSNFTRVFKQHFDMTPSKYRSAYR